MARDGSGTYNLPAGNPVALLSVADSALYNSTLSDIAAALTASIASDGQKVPSANLPMGTYRHTNVGNAAARTDYVAAGQAQDSALQWLSSVSGTNAITASAVPAIAAYAAGQVFRFVASGANTGATTLAINGLTAQAVTKRGSVALEAGDIVSGSTVTVIYDGTRFQLVPANTGQFRVSQTTRDLTLAAGTQAITGVGFTPRAIVFFACRSSTSLASWGFGVTGQNLCVFDNNLAVSATYGVSNGYCIYLRESGSIDSEAQVTSLDADGFTLTWAKTGAPAGTATIFYLALR